jgi:hypothetical protein
MEFGAVLLPMFQMSLLPPISSMKMEVAGSFEMVVTSH